MVSHRIPLTVVIFGVDEKTTSPTEKEISRVKVAIIMEAPI
jgi:hypothetical protein